MALFTRTPGNVFLAHNATVVGDVTVGERSSFWFNAVVRGDVAPVTIGSLKTGGSLFVVADTVIGPVFVAYGRSGAHNSAAYIFLNRPF